MKYYYKQLNDNKLDNSKDRDKFLETYSLSRLNWKVIRDLPKIKIK